MAESESGQERTEEPSAKRLKDARERGDNPRSAELATAAVFLSAVAMFMALGGWMAHEGLDWMQRTLQAAAFGRGQGAGLAAIAAQQALELMVVVLPVIVVCLAAGFVAPSVMGWSVSNDALSPKLERLDPLAGIKRMWGTQGLGELVKSTLRVLLLGGIAWAYLAAYQTDLLGLMHQPAATAVPIGLGLILGLLLAMGVGIALLAALDAPFQYWQWKNRLKMTRQELIEEMKEMEGRPEVKAQMRRMAQQMASRRMMEEVPKADVVVVNPTHYAVAIRYDAKRMRAPRVVAKGVDEIALNIRKVAEQAKVAIVSAPPLARSLHAQVELDQEIPVKLYQAVAQVLSYVYQLKHWHPSRGSMPQLPDFKDLEPPPTPSAS